MSQSISFWTPVVDNCTEGAERCASLRIFEQMFNFGGRSVAIINIDGNQSTVVEAGEKETSLLTTALKIAILMTGVGLVVSLIGKYIYRSANKFVVQAQTPLPPPPPPPPLPQPQQEPSKINEIAKKIDEMVRSVAYVESYLKSLESDLNRISSNPDVEDAQKLFFIHEMLNEMAPALKLVTEEFKEHGRSYQLSDPTQLLTQYERIQTALKQKIKASAEPLQLIKAKLESLEETEKKSYFNRFISTYFNDDFSFKDNSFVPIKDVTGISNQGNSCWLNACVQSLFASPTFKEKLEKIELVEGDVFTPAVSALQTLNNFMTEGCNDPAVLGTVAALLRFALFSANIPDYEMRNLYSFHDPGPMYALMMRIVGFGFKQKVDRDAHDPIFTVSAPITEEMLFPIAATGKSIQNAINVLAKGERMEATIKGPSGKSASSFTEKLSIEGDPPEIFIFRAKEQQNALGNTTGHHKIHQDDFDLNMEILMVKKVPARYRLVGFAQNRGGYHWVAYGMKGSEWYCFNDSTVTPQRSVVGMNAHYLVYERVSSF